jgi:hypothetical protein
MVAPAVRPALQLVTPAPQVQPVATPSLNDAFSQALKKLSTLLALEFVNEVASKFEQAMRSRTDVVSLIFSDPQNEREIMNLLTSTFEEMHMQVSVVPQGKGAEALQVKEFQNVLTLDDQVDPKRA